MKYLIKYKIFESKIRSILDDFVDRKKSGINITMDQMKDILVDLEDKGFKIDLRNYTIRCVIDITNKNARPFKWIEVKGAISHMVGLLNEDGYKCSIFLNRKAPITKDHVNNREQVHLIPLIMSDLEKVLSDNSLITPGQISFQFY